MCFGIPTMARVKREWDEWRVTPFTRLVHQYLDGWLYRQSDAAKADRLMRDAYEAACEHVMAGGALPEEPVGAMPTADQLSAELQAANIQATITTESSSVGEVLFATYRLTINGAAAEARQFVVNASPNVAVISIIAGDPATADELATLVLASLTKV